jgi:hypothetical protein
MTSLLWSLSGVTCKQYVPLPSSHYQMQVCIDETHSPLFTLLITRSESDDMPFIAFDEPGRGTNHQQRIIRQHLGRQRRKKTSQAKSTKLKETEQQCKPQQDISAFLCSCDPIVPAFLRGMLENGGVVSLQPCPNCGKGHIVEQTADEHFPSPEAGPICDNFGDPFGALPISPKPNTHNLIRHCKRVRLLTSGSDEKSDA